MRKALKKLLILFVMINFKGLILEGAITVDNSKTTIANENKDKNGLNSRARRAGFIYSTFI